MNVLSTELAGIVVVETETRIDDRGSFTRLFCERELSKAIGPRRIVQINYSRTAAVGAVRGLHFQQPPHAEMKLVRCLRGRVWDIAVDLRADSPTCLQWYAEELTPGNARMLVVPEGCAHGFQVLEANSEILYLHTALYAPESERGIRFDDSRLAISWPLPVAELSLRDHQLPTLDANFVGIAV